MLECARSSCGDGRRNNATGRLCECIQCQNGIPGKGSKNHDCWRSRDIDSNEERTYWSTELCAFNWHSVTRCFICSQLMFYLLTFYGNAALTSRSEFFICFYLSFLKDPRVICKITKSKLPLNLWHPEHVKLRQTVNWHSEHSLHWASCNETFRAKYTSIVLLDMSTRRRESSVVFELSNKINYTHYPSGLSSMRQQQY